MRFARLKFDDTLVFARLEGAAAHLLHGAPWSSASGETGVVRPFLEGQLLCPVSPSKIVCIGRNYAAHAKELGNAVPTEPLLFFKPPSSLIGPGDAIVLPKQSSKVEHEAELGVVLGKRCKDASRDDALSFVFGYTCVNDVTARDLQKKDGQWARAKGFDTFCPVGPWIESALDPAACRVACRVNGEKRQDAPTSDMIFDVPALIAYVSSVMTLEPGDLIATGTPEGVSPLGSGDVVEVDVHGIGVLRARVAS